MPRKSLQRRLSETITSLELWVDAGLGSDRQAQFLRDMISRMQRGKGLSAGQRKYVDSLIDQGAPKIYNAATLALIDTALVVAGMEQQRQPLTDFRYKLSKGYELSEKQQAFLNGMLAQAVQLTKNGMPELSKSDRDLVVGLFAACRTQSNWYWSHRPGAHRAYQNAESMFHVHGTVTATVLERFKNQNKTIVRRYEEPRMHAGLLAYIQRDPAVIMSTPYFNTSGVLVQDVLVAGELKTVPEAGIKKRRSRA
jgi:hypothetical protein